MIWSSLNSWCYKSGAMMTPYQHCDFHLPQNIVWNAGVFFFAWKRGTKFISSWHCLPFSVLVSKFNVLISVISGKMPSSICRGSGRPTERGTHVCVCLEVAHDYLKKEVRPIGFSLRNFQFYSTSLYIQWIWMNLW